MDILIVRETVDIETLKKLASAWHETLVKGVADCKREVLALGGEWHIDANNVLLADGSKQEDVWGFNIYPEERGDAAVEYTSLINVRPVQGNRSMELMDEARRLKIRELVKETIPFLFV